MIILMGYLWTIKIFGIIFYPENDLKGTFGNFAYLKGI
jgi:hypothetical protein